MGIVQSLPSSSSYIETSRTMAGSSAHRFWRLRVTSSSESGWESYIRCLQFTSKTHTLPHLLLCWSLPDTTTGPNRNALRAFDVSSESTAGYRTTQNPGSRGDFIAVEYAEPVEIVCVSFQHHNGSGNSIKSIALDFSDDGITWVPLLHGRVCGESFDSNRDSCSPSEAGAWGVLGDPGASAATQAYDAAVASVRREAGLSATADAGMALLHAAAVAACGRVSLSTYPCEDGPQTALSPHVPAAGASTSAPVGASRTTVPPILYAPPPPWASRGLSAALWRGRGVVVERRSQYQANICCPGPVTVFSSPRVALVVSDAARAELGEMGSLLGVQWVLDALERMLAAFDATVGKAPDLHAPVVVPSSEALTAIEGHASTRPGASGHAIHTWHSTETRRCVPYEVAYLDGAGGLAHHSIAGVAVGPAFLLESYKSAVAACATESEGAALPRPAGTPADVAWRPRCTLHHAFWYETTRNYIWPEEFTALFDYELRSERPDCWGWVNQGFVNVLGALLAPCTGGPGDPAVGFVYYGRDREGFMADMEAQLWQYIAGDYDWDAVFMRERVPWSEGTSLDNVYSGLLVHLCRLAGGASEGRAAPPAAAAQARLGCCFPCDDAALSTLDAAGAFLRRWFRVAMPLLLQPDLHRLPSSKADHATARDNFVLAASIAAGVDLSGHFARELRWPVGRAIASTVDGGGGLAEALVALADAASSPWPTAARPSE